MLTAILTEAAVNVKHKIEEIFPPVLRQQLAMRLWDFIRDVYWFLEIGFY